MKVQILASSPWPSGVKKALARAKRQPATKRGSEVLFDCLIKYHNGTAVILPFSTSQCVPLKLPNPIPYRGVSIGVVSGVITYVVASDGETLASEVRTTTVLPPPGGLIEDSDPTLPWNGSNYVRMVKRSFGKDLGDGPIELAFHDLAFTVPEDCVYPLTPTPPDYPSNNDPANPPPPASIAQWNADWAAGQTALKQRRRRWFKKNHDTVLAQLVAGTYRLPSAWSFQLKTGGPKSAHTYRPVAMTVDYADSVIYEDVGDDARMTQTRSATFRYAIAVKDSSGNITQQTREKQVTGTMVFYDVYSNTNSHAYRVATFTDWWALPNTPSNLPAGGTTLAHQQLLIDGSSNGMGLLWNGVSTYWIGGSSSSHQWFPDSSYGLPAYDLATMSSLPESPPRSNSAEGTAPEFIVTYRQDVPIKYDATGALASTAWNDSTLQDGQSVSLILFGPQGKGMFGEWEDADTTAEVFGTAIYAYDTGDFSFKRWTPADTTEGRNLVSVTAAPSTNSIIKYNDLIWADVIAAAKASNTALKAPAEGQADTRTALQIFIAAVLAAAKAAS